MFSALKNSSGWDTDNNVGLGTGREWSEGVNGWGDVERKEDICKTFNNKNKLYNKLNS